MPRSVASSISNTISSTLSSLSGFPSPRAAVTNKLVYFLLFIIAILTAMFGYMYFTKTTRKNEISHTHDNSEDSNTESNN